MVFYQWNAGEAFGKPVWIQSITAMFTVNSGANITHFSFKTHPVFLSIKFTAWSDLFWCIWMQGMISHFDNKTINEFLLALRTISRHCSLTWIKHACSWDVFISLDHSVNYQSKSSSWNLLLWQCVLDCGEVASLVINIGTRCVMHANVLVCEAR